MNNLIDEFAPNFKTNALMEDNHINEEFELYKEIDGFYCFLFFYPLNFTFVCPSELISINNKIKQFKNENTKIFTISVDSVYSHKAWKNTPIENGGIGNIQFPMISDLGHEICDKYNVKHNTKNIALRSSCLIDKSKKIKAQYTNDLPIGRNINELIRIIQALKFYEEKKQVCPAGWNKGNDGITTTNLGISNYLKKNKEFL